MKGFNLADRVEFLRSRTTNVNREMQQALIPAFNTGPINRKRDYTFNGERVIQYRYELIFLVRDLKYKSRPVKWDILTKVPLKELVDKNYMLPIMVFINGKFIPWSNITISYDLRYTYVTIQTPGVIVKPEDVQVLEFPFPIRYSESGEVDPEGFEIFRFNENGELDEFGDYVVTTRDTNLFYHHYSKDMIYNEIIDYIPSNYKLTDANVITFKDNLLHRKDRSLQIKGLNILTLDSGAEADYDVFLFYDKRITFDYDIIQIPNNKDYVRQKIIEYDKDPSVSNTLANDITAEFNFNFSPLLDYGENLRRAIKTICGYNTNLLGEYYAPVVRTLDFTGAQIKSLTDEDGFLRMLRLKTISELDTFVVVFQNGIIYHLYRTIRYDLNSFTLKISGIEDDDIIEFVYFQNVNNRVVKGIHVDENTDIFGDYFIPSDEVVVFTQTSDQLEFPAVQPTDDTWYPVDVVKQDRYMKFNREYFYGKTCAFAAVNQFRYCFFNISENKFKVKLPKEFSLCTNENQYLIFVNGRKIDSDYKLVFTAETTPFYETAIYLTMSLKPNDRIEILYLPMPVFSDVLKPRYTIDAEVYSKPNSKEYKIPMPYANFLKDGNSIIPYVLDDNGDNRQLKPEEYTISEDGVMTLSEDMPHVNKVVCSFLYSKEVGLEGVTAYIHINRFDAPIGIDKNLFFIFVNGKKVMIPQLQDISESIIKITEDIGSTEQLSILRYITPEIELTRDPSLWDSIVNRQDYDTLNTLMGTYNVLSNTEEVIKPDLNKLAIMNEIVRDYYAKPNVNKGVPFLFDYDNTQYPETDAAGNFLVPIFDAKRFDDIYEKDKRISNEELLAKYGPKKEEDPVDWI